MIGLFCRLHGLQWCADDFSRDLASGDVRGANSGAMVIPAMFAKAGGPLAFAIALDLVDVWDALILFISVLPLPLLSMERQAWRREAHLKSPPKRANLQGVQEMATRKHLGLVAI